MTLVTIGQHSNSRILREHNHLDAISIISTLWHQHREKPDQNSAHIVSPVFKVDKNSPLGLVRQQMPPYQACGIRTPLKKKELSSDLEWLLIPVLNPRTTDTQWRHKSKISEKLGRCGRQNMLRAYLKIWDWDRYFGRAVKAISSLGIHSPWLNPKREPGEFELESFLWTLRCQIRVESK